jgi:4-amino-4-deoxy-L-arabinose transferase-like glycosyltransferase
LSVIFSAGNAILVYLISEKLFDKRNAILAALFFTTSAMFIYFSSGVFPEPMAIFFSLLCFLLFINYVKRESRSTFILMLIVAAIACSTVWGSFFLVPPLLLYYFYQRKRVQPQILILGIVPFMVFLIFLVQNFILTGSFFGGGLIDSLLFRLNLEDKTNLFNFSAADYLKRETMLLSAYYSKLTLFLSLLWILYITFNLNRKNNDLLILPLLSWGVSYPLVFRNASFIHDYFLIYLAPFIAISAARAANLIYEKTKSKIPALASNSLLFALPLIQLMLILKFASALIKSGDLNPYLLGIYLQSNTTASDKVLILSSQYGSHFGVFTNFYADKQILYRAVSSQEMIPKDYQYIVFVPERETPKEIDDYLSKKYFKRKFHSFNIYKVDK